jgi:hypothetical protein
MLWRVCKGVMLAVHAIILSSYYSALSVSLIFHELEEPVRVRLRVHAADVRLALCQRL